MSRKNGMPRFCSSHNDGQNTGENNENTNEKTSQNDQIKGLATEKPSAEGKNKKFSLSSTRGERFKNEFLRRIVPCEKIPISLEAFPYYIDERAKTLLVECTSSHLKQKKFRKYGGRLNSSSNRILLQSIPGTGLYRERLVSALAKELQVPILKLDSSVLPPYDFSQEYTSESKSDEESWDSYNESDWEKDEDDATNEEKDTSCDAKSTTDSAVACEKCAAAKWGGTVLFKEGDRVEYIGQATSIKEADNRILSKGQRGEVYGVKGNKVGVVFRINGLATKEAENDEKSAENDEKSTEKAAQAFVTWLDAKHVKQDRDAQTHDCYIAVEVLCEILESQQPIVVYFPALFSWLSSKASNETRSKFFGKFQEMFDRLSGRVVLICGQNKGEVGPGTMEKFEYIKSLKATTDYDIDYRMYSLFTNVIHIEPPKDEDHLKTFVKQIEEDRVTEISEGNLSKFHKVFKEHGLLCTDLENAIINDTILTRQKVEEVVGWATNHYLSSCPVPRVEEDRLHVPHESLKLAISRLKEQETEPKKPSKSIKDLASGEYERRLVSAVVSPSDIGVKFDDVGALEHVKKELYELIILPLKRPELFSHGNLLRPSKGALLFGPPGTGKTLIAKAIATEAGANFISVTSASITSMWYGESEKYTKALFSYASKLAPVVIFVDEIDALLGARGRCEHEATRRLKNEFMAAWDGLSSKDSQRILVLGATNRPFDLDDAVIRRMPRRIYVDLPDVANRCKILKVILAEENLESEFSFEQLAEATDGYSGSDLKHLCVAAAFRPVQELVEKESKGERSDGVPALRPLNLSDFIHSKAKVGPSVAYNASSVQELRQWNEQYGVGGSRRK